jgi:hypothetical protein
MCLGEGSIYAKAFIALRLIGNYALFLKLLKPATMVNNCSNISNIDQRESKRIENLILYKLNYH